VSNTSLLGRFRRWWEELMGIRRPRLVPGFWVGRVFIPSVTETME
jgi:hypothetical protein